MRINGLKVVDATKPVKVHITPHDVKYGDSKNPSSCAAARACIRQKLCTEARIHLGRTYLKQGDKWIRFMTGKALRTEIVSFDRGAKFQPGDFMLYKMGPGSATTGKARGSSTNQTRPKTRIAKKRVYRTITGVRQHGANR